MLIAFMYVSSNENKFYEDKMSEIKIKNIAINEKIDFDNYYDSFPLRWISLEYVGSKEENSNYGFVIYSKDIKKKSIFINNKSLINFENIKNKIRIDIEEKELGQIDIKLQLVE